MPPHPRQFDSRVASQESAPSIAISATFTAESLEPSLAFWVKELGWNYAIRFAAYNQVFQQLLDPGGLLAGTRNGVAVVLVRWEDWTRFPEGAPQDEADLEQNVNRFLDALRAAASSFASPLIVCTCPASPRFLELDARAAIVNRLESLVREGIAGLPAVSLIGSAELARLYPVAEPHDPHGDELGKIPYTPVLFAALGTVIARKIHALRQTPYKVIALDCDGTLWRGICGEDGPQGIVIDPPHRRLQEFMAAQRDSGMLLCLLSKNNEEDVLETFRAHPEMPLRLHHFPARRINWEPKAAGLASLAEELSLGLDSFIFVDDDSRECTEVQARCPDVLVLPLPGNAAEIPAFLDHVWALDHARVTEEDRRRAAMYVQHAERARLERQASSFEEFLAGLGLEVRIAPMAPAEVPRVAQLTRRTNQMNVAGVRRTEAEVRAAVEQGAECLAVQVSDRFGSYGLTGVVIFRVRERALAVDTFLLSCRALGRGVEHRMLAALGAIARERSLDAVEVPFVPAQRNRPAGLFLESIGAAFQQPRGAGRLYRFPADCAAAVVYQPAVAPARPAAPENDSSVLPSRPLDYARIAAELRDPAAIVARLPRATGVPASSRRFIAPRSELERRLAEIWKQLLGLGAIGVDDNFFDLGGHSLLAVQLLSRVRREFGVELSLEIVYGRDFTIAEMAKSMEVKEIGDAAPEEYADLLREVEDLSDEEVRALLVEEDDSR